MGKSERHFGNNDEWCTQRAIYEPLVRVWGAIGLDPCHSPRSNVPASTIVWHDRHFDQPRQPRVPVQHWYRGDGLLFSWNGHGLVFVNMPYSDTKPWGEKASKEGDEVVLYLPARTGSSVWQDVIFKYASAIHFLKRGQIFEQDGVPATDKKGRPMQAPWHSALPYFGPHPQKLELAFRGTGRTVFL